MKIFCYMAITISHTHVIYSFEKFANGTLKLFAKLIFPDLH